MSFEKLIYRENSSFEVNVLFEKETGLHKVLVTNKSNLSVKEYNIEKYSFSAKESNSATSLIKRTKEVVKEIESNEEFRKAVTETETETVLTVRLNRELANRFTESCKAEVKTKAEKTRELINDYLKNDSLIPLNYSEIGCIGYLLKKEIDQCNIEIESRENIDELQKVDTNWLAMKGYYINRKIYLTKLEEKLNKYDLKDVPF